MFHPTECFVLGTTAFCGPWRGALRLADSLGLHLEGLGGTGGGVIGALAAVEFLACGDDGRVVPIGLWPDDLSGAHDVESLRTRGVEVRRLDSRLIIREGLVDGGKRLRPNVRGGRVVLFVTEHGDGITPNRPSLCLQPGE